MYRYDQWKTYAIRLSLRKFRPLLLMFVPVVYFLSPPNLRIYLYFLLVLELLILLMDFSRRKRAMSNHNPSVTDWIIISGTTIFVYGMVMLSGGETSPLILLLLTPTLLFSQEFGVRVGLINLTLLLSALILHNFYRPVSSLENSLFGVMLFFFAGLLVLVFASQNRILVRYNHKLLRMLIRDDLTGLYNRRYLKTKVLQAIKRRTTFSLIMLDINYFKYYNDQWGHTMGDSLLKKIGEVLKQAVSSTDIVVRISGDEFIIFIERAIEGGITQAAQKIQYLIEERHFPGEECFPQKKVSLTFGTVCYPENAVTFEELMEKADQELYRHKRAAKLQLNH